MRLSTLLQYWILLVLVPLVSLAAPVKPNPASILRHGQIVKIAPKFFHKASKQLDKLLRDGHISRKQWHGLKSSGNKHHPAVVVDGPHANGKVTLAPVSHNHDPFGIHQPTIDMKHFLTSDHKLTGFVSLLAVQAKAKFTSDTHHADLTHSALNDLKAHMGTNTGWKVGDSVASEHSGPAPPGAESSAGEPGSKHHSGQGSNHGQSTSQHASQSHPPSHTGHKASSQGTTGNPSSILSKVKAGVSWKSKKSKKS